MNLQQPIPPAATSGNFRRTARIAFGGTTYFLKSSLEYEMVLAEGYYLISNRQFDLSVWGETQAEAEEAFGFAFHGIYENYALESDDKLSKEAKLLKYSLLSTVQKVIHED